MLSKLTQLLDKIVDNKHLNQLECIVMSKLIPPAVETEEIKEDE